MTLAVESRGRGRDLVLLHGWGAGGAVWGEFADRLATRVRLHVVDLPGYGDSDGIVGEPYTLHALCTQLVAQLPPRTAVCGWSLGGQLALQWATAAPQQVERLVLIATTPCFVARADWPHGMRRPVFDAFQRDFERDRMKTLSRFADLQAHGDARSRAVRLLLHHAAREQPPDPAALTAGLCILRDTDLRATLDTVSQPALVMHGRCDAVVAVEAAQRLGAGLSGSRTCVIDHCAHVPFLSQPETAASLIADFVNE
ncbi:MAG TPA: pimeloyl-ACP methyl ester esterase BioH [Burkholderiales bacterium]|nr:pimeloyl-ACP methyl ester esterase BioH [Burkholderiales bacterium]